MPLTEMKQVIENFKPDIIVAGELGRNSEALDVLEALSSNLPVALIMDSQFWLTGRCVSKGNCDGYLTGCTECPLDISGIESIPSTTAMACSRKRQLLLDREDLRLFCANEWLADRARGILHGGRAVSMDEPFRERIVSIGPSIDCSLFAPQDKMRCRKFLGLPEHQFIILSRVETADSLDTHHPLFDALRKHRLPNAHLLLIGESISIPDDLPCQCSSISRLDDQQFLALYYAASDLFVVPLLKEHTGQMVLEASSCGTPVIGYDVGGVSEVLFDGLTGLLADTGDPLSLGNCIRRVYSDIGMRGTIREIAPVVVNNRFSYFSVYHRFLCALRKAGLAQRICLRPAIYFTTPEISNQNGFGERPADAACTGF
ncbi:MAG: glycosyltransferase [Syntrophobacteraceae bacterium]